MRTNKFSLINLQNLNILASSCINAELPQLRACRRLQVVSNPFDARGHRGEQQTWSRSWKRGKPVLAGKKGFILFPPFTLSPIQFNRFLTISLESIIWLNNFLSRIYMNHKNNLLLISYTFNSIAFFCLFVRLKCSPSE